ncbi:hypothetical protein E2I00_010504 [Balaenoptera physalus]|uniref:G-protein coupled receptors family 1 profile domain-containing protein n=1 Tax=Balaenoptera physalus TaxID=9770 RepID=A0A643BUD5_BALPH|nr:hypothetical protein E2I00_010504 [Balaenoptera physalus]
MTQVMTSGNQKRVTEFLFSVFPHLHECALLLFIPLLLIYGLIITGNLMIFIVIQLDMILNTSHIWYTMTTIPKMLSCLVSEQKTTYLAGCLMQMYFFYSLGITEDCVLTAMAIDRYIAICNPLHYPTIMTPKLCIHLTAGSCLCGFLLCFLRFHGLPPCLSTQQIFCDSTPVLRLACTDTSLVVIVDAIREVEILASFLVITLSYNRIIVVILGMPSAEGHHKAFSTCAAHLAVFLFVTVMYLRFSATYSVLWGTTIAVPFVILAPFLNLIFYSLRNKDMKDAIGRLFCCQKRAGGVGS